MSQTGNLLTVRSSPFRQQCHSSTPITTDGTAKLGTSWRIESIVLSSVPKPNKPLRSCGPGPRIRRTFKNSGHLKDEALPGLVSGITFKDKGSRHHHLDGLAGYCQIGKRRHSQATAACMKLHSSRPATFSGGQTRQLESSTEMNERGEEIPAFGGENPAAKGDHVTLDQ